MKNGLKKLLYVRRNCVLSFLGPIALYSLSFYCRFPSCQRINTGSADQTRSEATGLLCSDK